MTWNLGHLFGGIDEHMAQVTELPPMPDVGRAILELQQDADADAKRLGRLVELDPSLAAQIMRYANSAFFGYRGKIGSIQEAISRVLGFDKAMYIALGLAAGQALRHSAEGPLGIQAFWRHALYSASLMQMLADEVPPDKRPLPGLVYLSGLVHNIGILLLGHSLRAEFDTLNNAVVEQPDQPVTDLEKQLLGITHCDLGAWLLRRWKMPPEVLAVVYEHHNETYQGDYYAYVNLALIADRLLKREGLGDAPNGELPSRLMDTLELSEEQAELVLGRVMGQTEGLEALVRNLVHAAA